MLEWLLITLQTATIHAMFRGYNLVAQLQHPLSLVLTPFLGHTYNLPLLTFPLLYGALRLALRTSFATQAVIGLVLLHAITLYLHHLRHCTRCCSRCCVTGLFLVLPSLYLAIHLSSILFFPP